MTIKFSKAYQELKNQYDTYTSRRGEKLEAAREGLKKAEIATAELEALMSKPKALDGAEAYQRAGKELDEARRNRDFFSQLLDSIEKEKPVTEEEQKNFRAAYKTELKRLETEAEEKVYKALLPVLDIVESYTAQIHALQCVGRNADEVLFGKINFSNGRVPALLDDVSRVAVASFRAYDSEHGRHGYFTEGMETIQGEVKELRAMSKKVKKHPPTWTFRVLNGNF